MEKDLKMTRRGFVWGLFTLCATALTGCATTLVTKTREVASRIPMPDFGPINRKNLILNAFSGDNPDKAHLVLWNIKKKNKRPELIFTEKKRLVIVGGGMSGLITAHLLKEYSPVILEQAERMGGNAKGESLSGIDYSIGAAYIARPELDSEAGKLLLELGLFGKWRERSDEDPVEISSRKVNEIWTDGQNENALRLKEYFTKLYSGSEGVPEIPFRNKDQRELVEKLDKKSLLQHLQDQIVGDIPPPVFTLLDNYCRSSFGTGASETSAAAGLNFLSGEFNPICYFPGGNSAISEKLTEKLFESLPEDSLRVSSLVTNVKATGAGAETTYVDASGNKRRILSDAVVMACPKFVVKRILEGIETKRTAAIEEIEYRAYTVANVLINKKIDREFYDLFFLSQKEQGLVTDVIYGGQSLDSKQTVLTLYAPLAYSGGRGDLFSETYEGMRKKFEEQLEKTILPFFKMKKTDIEELRITRWGHPMPAAKTGIITSKALETVRTPFKDKVFFVEQDNWCLPAFETCVAEANYFAPQIAELLKRNFS